MRKQTLVQITAAVQELENSIIHYAPENGYTGTELQVAIDYVYWTFMRNMDTTSDYDRAVRFDGKAAIMAEIKKQIEASSVITIVEKAA